jgi:Fe-S oxidoreductase
MPGRRVVLWDDTWVRYHEPGIGQAAVRVLEAAGFQVVLARGRKCCGRPAFSRGLLDEAARLGAHNVALLESRYPDLPVIFLEPSCHSMFVDDYLQLRIPGAERLAQRCQLFEQFMCELLDREPGALDLHTEGGTSIAIHAHCHAKALGDATVMKRLVQHVRGAEPTLLDTGCCGMAGAFGMSREKYDLSLQVAEPMVEKLKALTPGTRVVASGTSCRHQITHLTPVRPLHMAEVLAAALEAREPDAARRASLTS